MDDSIANARREEAIERKRDAERREFDQIMKPLAEPITLLKETARELLRRTSTVPYLSAERDTRGEAERIMDAIEDAEKGIRRSIRDAVEV